MLIQKISVLTGMCCYKVAIPFSYKTITTQSHRKARPRPGLFSQYIDGLRHINLIKKL